MSRLKRLLSAASLLVVGGCFSNDTGTPQDRMLSRRSDDAWVEADPRTPEGQLVIADELARAHGAVVSAVNRLPAARVVEDEPRRATSRPSDPPLKPWPGPKLSIVFSDTPLKEVVAAVAGEMKINAVLPDDLDQSVTVNFPSIDPLLGLDTILRQRGRRVRFDREVLTVASVENPQSTQTFTVRSDRAFDPDKLVKPMLTSTGSVVNDPVRKQFTVTDDGDALDRVAAFMRTADTRAQQVLIEALIVEVRRGKDSAHGAALDAGDVKIGHVQGVFKSQLAADNAPVGAIPPFSFGVVDTSSMLQGLLSARSGKSKFNVLSNPLVAAISGTEAEMKVVERIPYVQSTNSINVSGAGAATDSLAQIQFEEVGVTLTVTPEIGADNIVKMKVVPDVRELVDFSQGVPVIDSRKVTSNVLVRNNETLVIGGLLRSAHRKRTDKVPVLGDVPLLGDLFFKREVEENERVELLIFVTPHLTGFGSDTVEGFRGQDDLLKPHRRFPLVDDELERNPEIPNGVKK